MLREPERRGDLLTQTVSQHRMPRPAGRNDTEVSIFTAMTQENIVHNYKDLSGFMQMQGKTC